MSLDMSIMSQTKKIYEDIIIVLNS